MQLLKNLWIVDETFAKKQKYVGTVVDESASKQLMGRRHLKVVTKLLHLKILLQNTRKYF